MSMDKKSFYEKRNFTRMKIDTMITFTLEGRNDRYEARCKNISGAGLLLETEKKLEEGSKINVSIPSESGDIENLNASADVIRCLEMKDQHKYEIGCIITKIQS